MEEKNVSGRFQIRVSEILEIQKRKREINGRELNEIDFLDDDGMPLKIDEKIIEEFRFSGLNNTDFITTEFYKNGFDGNP